MTTTFYSIVLYYFDLKGQGHNKSICRSEGECGMRTAANCNAAILDQCKEYHSEFILVAYYMPLFILSILYLLTN